MRAEAADTVSRAAGRPGGRVVAPAARASADIQERERAVSCTDLTAGALSHAFSSVAGAPVRPDEEAANRVHR